MTPFATIHFAADPSFAETHSSMVLPSKSTIASEGASAFDLPGVITGGTGSHTSVSAGLGAGLDAGTGFCAARDVASDAVRAIRAQLEYRRMRYPRGKEYGNMMGRPPRVARLRAQEMRPARRKRLLHRAPAELAHCSVDTGAEDRGFAAAERRGEMPIVSKDDGPALHHRTHGRAAHAIVHVDEGQRRHASCRRVLFGDRVRHERPVEHIFARLGAERRTARAPRETRGHVEPGTWGSANHQCL